LHRGFFELPSQDNRTRVNDMIRIHEVRLVGVDGQQIGVVSTMEAKRMAQEQGLDLVEVAPMARPPVCRIMDYGKFRFEEAKKDKVSKAKQHIVKIKELKYHPRTGQHDYEYRLRQAIEFLDEGNKVKATVVFRGREMAHMDYGKRILDRMVKDLVDIAVVEQNPNMEGRALSVLFAPSKSRKKPVGAAPSEKPTAPDLSQNTPAEEVVENA